MRFASPRRGAFLVAVALTLLVTTPVLASSPVVVEENPASGGGSSLSQALAGMETMLAQETANVGAQYAMPLRMLNMQRTVVTGNIAHYTFDVRFGTGKYDYFRLHRVVKETKPCRPIRTAKNVFLQHGDAKDFTGMFLPGLYSPSTPDDFGLAVFLARNGVDVWGNDQTWALVPADETDFAFMADYGIDRATRDLRLAVAVARAVRLATACGPGKMILGGYSSGVFETIALLNQETQLPPMLKQIGAYIQIDCPFRTDNAELQQYGINDLAYEEACLAAGQYQQFVAFSLLGHLGRTQPDDPSPVVPGLTNYQAVCYFSFSTGILPPPPFHYWAGNLDPSGSFTGPRLTDREMWLDFLESAITWQPTRFFRDYDLLFSLPVSGLDSPYDDYLGLIRVPVLDATPMGGMGPVTLYSIALFGSQDVEVLMPSVGPPAETDIGHIDIFTWPGVEDLFWQPILTWIGAHTDAPGGWAFSAEDDGLAKESAPQAGNPTLTFGLERIVPNPQRGPLVLSFVLADDTPAKLEVVNIAGRLVHSAEIGDLGAGRHQLQLGGTTHLPTGIYLVKLSQNGQVASQRVTVLQ
jgi:hypothetical protein